MSSSSKKKWKEKWLWKGVEGRRPIGIVDFATLQPDDHLVSSASNCKLLCSYDWQNKKKPTIRVPGHAPVWQEKQLPVTLSQDMCSSFVDQNAARLPEYSFETLFRAVTIMNPSFQFDEVDVVLNRNTLRKLLDFCKGTSLDSFRVNLSIIKETLMIERCSQHVSDMVGGHTGYGKGFERMFTQPPKGIIGDTSHHRVLQYSLGKLNCVIRFEVDACYEDKETCKDENTKLKGPQTKPIEPLEDAINGLSLDSEPSELGGVRLSSESRAMKGRTKLSSNVDQTHTMMPQSTAAELKTISGRKGLSSIYPQLWFGRTPWLIIGHHKSGTITDVRISHMGANDFIDWEMRNQLALRKIVTVIGKLRDIVKSNKGHHCVAVFERSELASRAIKVYASTLPSKKPVSEDLIKASWSA